MKDKLYYKIIKSIFYIPMCKILYNIEIVGQENIPKEGRVIIAGNHTKWLDPVMIVLLNKRQFHFLAKEELRKNPFFAFLGMVFEGIYVKRDSKDITAMKEALKRIDGIIKENRNVQNFPQEQIRKTYLSLLTIFVCVCFYLCSIYILYIQTH